MSLIDLKSNLSNTFNKSKLSNSILRKNSIYSNVNDIDEVIPLNGKRSIFNANIHNFTNISILRKNSIYSNVNDIDETIPLNGKQSIYSNVIVNSGVDILNLNSSLDDNSNISNVSVVNLKSNLSNTNSTSEKATLFNRIAQDVKRIGNVLDPSKQPGAKILFTQSGLQLSNPKMTYDLPTDPLLYTTKIYNGGVNILASVATSPLGIHPKRHGLLPVNEYNTEYENYTKSNNLPLYPQDTNRLIALRKDLLESTDNQPSLSKPLNFLNNVNEVFKPHILRHEPIVRLSGLGGPNSTYGIGATIIHRFDQTFTLFNPVNYTATNQASNTIVLNNPINGDLNTNITIDKDKITKKSTIVAFNTSLPQNKQYATLRYDQLSIDNNSEKDFVQRIITDQNVKANFIPDLEKSKTTYSSFSRVGKMGLPDSNTTGTDRSDFTKVQDRSDIINITEIGEELPTHTIDYIKFYFTDIEGNNKINFRAIFPSGFTDSLSAGWNTTQILGKADPIHTYQSYNRTLSFDFKVVTNSREELLNNYKKINDLFSYLAPEYVTNNRMIAPLMRLTIGDYFIDTPGYITSIAPSINDSPWEINLEGDLLQLPHHMDINVSYTIIGNKKPELHGSILDASSQF